MARINLLPWRAERRKLRQKEFMTHLAGAMLAGVAAVLLGSTYFNGQLQGQQARNTFLEQEIQRVEAQITEIEGLEARKASLQQRKEVIQNLQAHRSQNVKLFEELARTIPDGVRLVSIQQSGQELTIFGRTQSNANVSAYMRNLEASGLITQPRLGVIRASAAQGADRALPFEFEMKVLLRTPGEESAAGDAVPATPPPATPTA